MLTPYRAQSAAEMAGAGDSALNWYSRRLAGAIESAGVHVSIVSPIADREEGSPWSDAGGMTVHPSFRRGAASAVFQAYRQIVKLPSAVVHVQHELFAFGGLTSALLLPSMLRLITLRGKKVLITIHGVIPLAKVTDEFVRANRIPGNAFAARALWRWLIRGVANASSRVHVHEPFLRTLLVEEYGIGEDRIEVIPLGIEPAAPGVSRNEAREKYGIPPEAEVALFFGYLAAYKGIEYLLSEMQQLLASRPDLHLIIAGAVPARLEGTIDPQLAVRQLTNGAERVHLLGFVPDEEAVTVFAATDVVLLPYRVAMSSSGPLALAIGYNVPVLLSDAFRDAFPDAPGYFALNTGGLTRAVVDFMTDRSARSGHVAFIDKLRNLRNWPRVAREMIATYERLK